MSVFETLVIMISFATFTIAILSEAKNNHPCAWQSNCDGYFYYQIV